MAFWWVAGGMLVLVGAVVLQDKSTRHKVIRTMAQRWERRQGRGSVSRKKAKARQHVRRAKAKQLPQAKPTTFERPRRPRLVATKCSAACRTSRKPAFDRKTGRLTCDCPCGGREHGMYRRGSTAQPKVATKTAVGTSGTKKAAAPVSTPKPAAPKPGGVTNVNEGGTVGVQRGKGMPGTRVTNINRGGVVGIQAGTVSGETVVVPPRAKRTEPKAPTPADPPRVTQLDSRKPPPPPRKWTGLQETSWRQMKIHGQLNPQCVGGTFAATTYRDRRTDPPRVTQEIRCETCGETLGW